MCQWANALGATVIGTVSTKEKAAQAKDDGCHHVIIYKEEDFVTCVNEITSGQGVDVVYDSVGKDTFQVLAFKFVLFQQVSRTSLIRACNEKKKKRSNSFIRMVHHNLFKCWRSKSI